MAIRTTKADVRSITGITSTKISDSDLDVYLTGANAIVTDQLGTSSLGETLLATIEAWVTAHLISVSRLRQGAKEQAGEAKIEYTGKYGMGLNSTSYGQMAIALDTTGALGRISDGLKSVVFKAINTNY